MSLKTYPIQVAAEEGLCDGCGEPMEVGSRAWYHAHRDDVVFCSAKCANEYDFEGGFCSEHYDHEKK